MLVVSFLPSFVTKTWQHLVLQNHVYFPFNLAMLCFTKQFQRLIGTNWQDQMGNLPNTSAKSQTYIILTTGKHMRQKVSLYQQGPAEAHRFSCTLFDLLLLLPGNMHVGVYLHDPATVLAAVDPSLFTYTEGVVRVQTMGITRGLTILYNNQKR